MDIPDEAPVMTLPNATLFPQAMMRLHIFEPRYRRMLEEVLHSRRMFIIAMRKPGSSRNHSPNRAVGRARPGSSCGFPRESAR